MRRIDRRLVLLSFVLVCDVVSVFGRPQEHSTAGSQLKADSDGRVDNRYTAFATTTTAVTAAAATAYVPRTADTSCCSHSNRVTAHERHAEPDGNRRPHSRLPRPLPPFPGPPFPDRFPGPSSNNASVAGKRRKRHSPPRPRPPDSRIVDDFVRNSIRDLRNPSRADPPGSYVLVHTAGPPASKYKYDAPDTTHYLPVPTYTKGGGSYATAPQPYDDHDDDAYGNNWQETPLIFPTDHGHDRPTTTHHHHHHQHQHHPAFVTPVQHQGPTFVTPVAYRPPQGGDGPTFVTPISVGLQQGPPAPAIVILEDIDPGGDGGQPEPPPLQDDDDDDDPPGPQDDPAGAAGGSSSGAAAAAAAAGAAGAAGAAAAGAAGIVGVAGGVAVSVAAGGGGGAGGAGGAGGNGGLGGGAAAPAECRASGGGGAASKVCSELITVSSAASESSESSPTFLDGLISLLASLNFFGPLLVAFWSMLFPPMSIVLTSGLGVVSFLFPWILPRLWFGRRFGPAAAAAALDATPRRYDRGRAPTDDHRDRRQPYYYY